jgi:hypothetical protein
VRYLLEHEAGFDTERLGYPSILGCIAICYLTDVGLFGFHNAGNSAPAHWRKRADAFGQFVRGFGKCSGRALYGVSFVGNNDRGYTPGKVTQDWKQELKTFAKVLHFGGKVSGYDLAQTGFQNNKHSAYVEFRKVGAACYIYVKPWTPDTKIVKVPNPGDNELQMLGGRAPNKTVTFEVDLSGLQLVQPVVL